MPNLSKHRQLTILAGCYLGGLLIFAIFSYHSTKNHLLADIDRRLEITARASALLFPDSLHQTPISAQLSQDKELAIAKTLTNLSRSLDLAYIYTVVKDENQFRFTSSSATPNELIGENPKYKFIYWSSYPEASQGLKRSFAESKIQFDEYSDRWGSFRSIFLPVSKLGQAPYVIGVDIEKSHVHALAKKSVLEALATILLLSLICLPMYLYTRRVIVAHAALKERAFLFDEITQLPNKRRLEMDLQNCKHPHLIMLNIDRFYYVTSTYGQAFGDHVLSEFAYNLANYSHPELDSHQVYHIHLDEFAILVDKAFTDNTNEIIFNDFYQKVCNAKYRMPDDKLINFDAHFGASVEMSDSIEVSQLALREAQDKNLSIVVFKEDSDLPSAYASSLEKIQLIKKAIKSKRIIPYYHPIVSARTGKIEKYEVLSRIVDKSGEVIMMPDEFIPLMIRARIYSQLSLHILISSIEMVQRTRVRLSLNFCTHDILDPIASKRLLKTIARSGIASLLQFELLETDSLVPELTLKRFILKLKALGCQVGLDDLGKAYSNFDRLTSLPIDFVKIDRGVMQQISLGGADNTQALVLAERIVRFAKSKNIETIAEYCHSKELCELATGFGIDYLQGFWLAEPSAEIQTEVRSF